MNILEELKRSKNKMKLLIKQYVMFKKTPVGNYGQANY